MKKNILFAAALAALAFLSCEKKPDPIPSGGDDPKTLTASILTADKTSVVLTEENAASPALTLTWTSAATDVAVSYDVYLNLASRDLFTSPVKHSANSVLTVTFTQGELNGIISQLGATAATAIKIGVYASAKDRESVLSNLVSVNVTPYSEAFVNPTAIYVIGTATPYKWDKLNSPEVMATSTGVYKISAIPLRVLPVANNQSIKFAFSRDDSDPRYAGQKPGAAFGEITVVETGQGYEFFPATAGYNNGIYDITVDFNTMKMTLERKGDLPAEDLPDKLYPLGGCFDWSWQFADAKTLNKVSGLTYELKGVNMHMGDDNNPNGFKVFRNIDQWSPYFAMTDASTYGNVLIQNCEDTDIPQFYPGKLGYTDGKYDITMDFSSMKATFTRTGDVTADWPDILYLVGGTFNPQWSFSEDLVLTRGTDGLYTASSLQMMFGDDKDAGFRLYTKKDNWGLCFTYNNGGYDSTGIQLYYHDAGGDPPQILPGMYGYSDGAYDLSFNIDTMKLTLTAK